MESLRALIRELPSVLLGYSGGVDSACLAVVLRQELGRDRMLAVIGRSASYPAAQWETARGVAAQFDLPLLEIDTHELDDPDYRANPTNRWLSCNGDLRVRHHGDRARIEAEPAWIPWLAERLAPVAARFRALGFARVEIDPRGYRRGSLL